MTKIQLKIKHRGKVYHVNLDPNSNGEDLKAMLSPITRALPYHPKLLATRKLQDGTLLTSVALKPGQTIQLIGAPLPDGVEPWPMTRPYRYHSTPFSSPDNIRLLLLQSARSPEHPLIGSLAEEQRGAATAYTALSYCWADEDGCVRLAETLYLSQYKEMRITTSLAAALRRLRKPTAVIRLWVDAICINQRDDREKTAQIAEMAEVYGCARNVVAWLGAESERGEAAAGFMALRCLGREMQGSRYLDYEHIWDLAAATRLRPRALRSRLPPCPECT